MSMEPKDHTHIWLPWGSEVTNNWHAVGGLVHAKCIATIKGKRCPGTITFSRESWEHYRTRLPQFQAGEDSQ